MSAAAHKPAVPSPCVNVCRMHEASGLCVGCHRTLDEIAQWSLMDDEAKRAVWLLLRRSISSAGDCFFFFFFWNYIFD